MWNHSRCVLPSVAMISLAVAFTGAGCANRQAAELELNREVRYDRPEIRTVNSTWLDAQAPEPRHLQVEVTGDPGLMATFDLQGAADRLAMEETAEAGRYRGEYIFKNEQNGSFALTGRLSHPDAGEATRTTSPVVRIDKAKIAAQNKATCDDEGQASVRADLANVRILFATDSSDLSETARILLKRLVLALDAYPACRIIVQGHADQRGREPHNQQLGIDRATAVIDHLVASGVPSKALKMNSFGATRLVNTSETPEAWKQNRRVDFALDSPAN